MSKFGIDVSEHKGTINWDAVKSQVSYAILRLGWIGNKNNHTLDKQFERNYSECKRLGIPVGVYVYCYCNNANTARQGAEWTLQKLNGKSLELPVYIDMEDSSIKGMGKGILTDVCIAFNSVIEGAGLWAGVYANLDWFNNYLYKDTIKSKYTTWIAHYTSGVNKHEGEYDIWQNTSKGRINGISGNVDTNYMYRDLMAEIGKSSPQSIPQNVNTQGAGSYVVNTALNVRAGAGTGYRVATTLQAGCLQGIDYTQGNWGHLMNNAGWICLDYCSLVTTEKAGAYMINTDTLNVRKAPNTSSKITGTIHRGSKQGVNYTINNWRTFNG